jgi:CRISPR-associated protein Csb2
VLTISVEFLHGTFRASADDVALTGSATKGEWPPSPARLFSALVASDGTGTRSVVTQSTDAAELRALEGAPTAIYAARDHHANAVCGRFVVVDERATGAVQNYPARAAQLVRPGVRVAMRDPNVHYVWPRLELSDELIAALRLRAARVGYLGCADSPVRIRVSTALPPANHGSPYELDDSGDVVMPVPYAGFLDALDVAFDRWSRGAPGRRSWVPTQHARYRDPGSPQQDQEVALAPATIWLQFGSALRGRSVLAVADTLRRATLDVYTRLYGDDIPEALLGHHRVGTSGFEHVRWLPLPFVGSEHADGHVRGACVWLPGGTNPLVVDRLRTTLQAIEELVCPKVFRTTMSLRGGEATPWSTHPARWLGPSRIWSTVFPYVYERYVRKSLTLEVLAEWCAFAQLPAPVRFAESTVPFLRGAASPAPGEMFRAGRQARPYRHLRLEFAEPVGGPIAIGRYRHFGLGLLAPVQGQAGGVGE